jgi:glyceraldehyde-3-phosphate dehydrogenase (NADP+)
MHTIKEFTDVFPISGSLPSEFNLPQPVNQHEYLVDGELRTWNGPMQEVVSPVRLADSAALSRMVLGSYPKMSAEESLAAIGI